MRLETGAIAIAVAGLMFLAGSDFVLTGLAVLRLGAPSERTPRLLAAPFFRWVQFRFSMHPIVSPLARLLYAPKTMGGYLFVGGILMVVMGVLMLVNFLHLA